MAERRRRRVRKESDGLDGDFGPGAGAAGAEGAQAPFSGFAGSIPCGKDGCFLKPLGDLVTRFAVQVARRGHADSATRAATSGIELLKALRDFLDEEIAFAERAAAARRSSDRYTKIPVE